MSRNATARLLRRIFAPGEPSSMIVLRNAEQLPDAFVGQDLDVSATPGVGCDEVASHIMARGRELGWEPVCVSRRHHMVGLSLVHADGATLALHFDIFDGITFLSIPLLSVEELFEESFTAGGIRQLSKRAQAAATVIHHMAWSGMLRKQKYVDELSTVLALPAERRWFEDRAIRAFGPRLGLRLADAGYLQTLTQSSAARRLQYAAAVIAQGMRARPVATMTAIAAYAIGQVESLIHPPGVVGSPGDPFPGLEGASLSLPLACAISPHALAAPTVRSPSRAVTTVNGPRYETSVRHMWSTASPLRWFFPSGFLWLNAKRGRVILIDRLPRGLALLRELGGGSRWLASSAQRSARHSRSTSAVSMHFKDLADSRPWRLRTL